MDLSDFFIQYQRNFSNNNVFIKKYLSNRLKNLESGELINNDIEMLSSDRSSMVFHNKQYDRLLEAYVDKAKNTFDFRQKYATAFLWVSLGILIVILFALCYTIYTSIKSGMEVEKLSILVPVSVSFLTVYIVIPKIITNYLFNEKEEEYMARVIEKIQDFDKEIRKNLREEALTSHEKNEKELSSVATANTPTKDFELQVSKGSEDNPLGEEIEED